MPDLSALFLHPLPCVTIEKRTGLDGWWCWRVYVMREGQDPATSDYTDHTEHSHTMAAARALASRLGMQVADLSEDDY